jgi:hypothetical protein
MRRRDADEGSMGPSVEEECAAKMRIAEMVSLKVHLKSIIKHRPLSSHLILQYIYFMLYIQVYVDLPGFCVLL